jgi:hypothetical protein
MNTSHAIAPKTQVVASTSVDRPTWSSSSTAAAAMKFIRPIAQGEQSKQDQQRRDKRDVEIHVAAQMSQFIGGEAKNVATDEGHAEIASDMPR